MHGTLHTPILPLPQRRRRRRAGRLPASLPLLAGLAMAPPPGLIMVLAATAALAVGALMYVSIAAAPPGSLCMLGGTGWPIRRSSGREQQVVQQALASARALDLSSHGPGSSAVGVAALMQPRTVAEVAGVSADAMGRIGWRAGIRFASFGEEAGCCTYLASTCARQTAVAS